MSEKPESYTTHRLMLLSKDDERMFMSIDLTAEEAVAIFGHCGVVELDTPGDFDVDCYVQISSK